MMQSAEEHQDIPNEDVAVMPVAEPRKRHRGKKLIACIGETDANTEKINPGMMQSVEEHKDVLIVVVAVRPVGELKMRRRVGKSTAGRRGEPKELTRGNCACGCGGWRLITAKEGA
jgi:hypothetical protein